MPAALPDAAIFEDQNLIHILQPNQAMGDKQGGPFAYHFEKRSQQLLFGQRIEIGGGQVEDQDRGIFQRHAGNRQAPAFATR
jgi:hypothetical protein